MTVFVKKERQFPVKCDACGELTEVGIIIGLLHRHRRAFTVCEKCLYDAIELIKKAVG